MLNKLLVACRASIIVAIFFIPFSVNAAEGTLDTSSPPTETPTSAAKYSGAPKINFYLSDEKFLLIQVSGLLLKDTDGFTWGGADISALIADFKDKGIIKLTEREDGFQMDVSVPIEQLAGKNEFGVLYGNGNKLSAVVDSDKLISETQESTTASKGFGYTRLFGTITERGGCCYCGRCGTTYASYATVHFYAWRGSWVYIGSTTTNASGQYSVSYNGNNESHILIQATKNGKTSSVVVQGPACPCTASSVKSNLYLQ